MSLFTFFKRIFKKRTPKLGLALGSGGAKGAAHLGALKAFEEAGIKFDMVAGTSIGSVVGAMYSLNYNVEQMLKTVQSVSKMSKLDMLKMSLSSGQLEKVFEKALGDKTFQDTYLPFRAVATDLETGEEVVLSKGPLAKALLASSAIPPMFRPMPLDGKILIDGAYVNAVPCNVVESLGADLIIGIGLHNYPSNENIKSTLDLFYKHNGVQVQNRLSGLKYGHYNIIMPLNDYTSTDIKNFNKMFEIGYQTTIENMDNIKAAIKNWKKRKKAV